MKTKFVKLFRAQPPRNNLLNIHEGKFDTMLRRRSQPKNAQNDSLTSHQNSNTERSMQLWFFLWGRGSQHSYLTRMSANGQAREIISGMTNCWVIFKIKFTCSHHTYRDRHSGTDCSWNQTSQIAWWSYKYSFVQIQHEHSVAPLLVTSTFIQKKREAANSFIKKKKKRPGAGSFKENERYRLRKEIKLNYLHSKHRNADEANIGQDEIT